MLALLVNAGILVLAAATFNKAGQTSVTDIGDAHKMLAPLVGSLLAPKLFAIALLACGLNSTVTATLAGQIVMEGFLNIRLAAWARRLLTRAVAIIPAVVVIFWYGAEGTGKLLIFSQVVLAFQLPFAVVPLVLFTANRAKLGDLTSPRWLTLLCSLVAALIIALNIKLLWDIGRSLI
jgi:manganese transport protein